MVSQAQKLILHLYVFYSVLAPMTSIRNIYHIYRELVPLFDIKSG